jgi:hypothetical protein
VADVVSISFRLYVVGAISRALASAGQAVRGVAPRR